MQDPYQYSFGTSIVSAPSLVFLLLNLLAMSCTLDKGRGFYLTDDQLLSHYGQQHCYQHRASVI